MRGWKVVRELDSGVLVSSSCPTTVDGVVYAPGSPTRPRPSCGPLAVFTNNPDALHFIRDADLDERRRLFVLPCTYKPTQGRYALWDSHKVTTHSYLFPHGTDLADEVVLEPEGA